MANRHALDHLARSQLAAGDRKRALSTWDRVLGKSPTDRQRRTRFDLVLAAGLPAEARGPYGEALAAGWTRGGPLGDLRALASAFPSRAPVFTGVSTFIVLPSFMVVSSFMVVASADRVGLSPTNGESRFVISLTRPVPYLTKRDAIASAAF